MSEGLGSNLMVFDEPGNARRHLSPDIFVAFGVRSGSRDPFKIREEKPPSFVLAITSTARAKAAEGQAYALNDYLAHAEAMSELVRQEKSR